MTPRRSSRPTLPRLAIPAAALALTAVATIVSAPQAASAADPLPDGSTLVLSGLGSSTPGTAQAATVTLTAPDDSVDRDPNTPGVQGDLDTDRDALVDQDVALSVDHGFFTTGAEELPSVVGAPAGNLVQLGTSITEKTDVNGEVSFQVGIERDPGFDDDGSVAAQVTAQAETLSQHGSAGWTSASPLNGQVEVVLSPSARQENPVAPAVSGDRTWYDVFTRDQFGNPVDGEPVYLDFAGKLDDYDYSEDFVTSDLGHDGDFWLVSFVPGDLTVTGTWDAPRYRYTDTAGAAASSMADATGSATASFYDVDFNATSFALAPSTSGDVAVGTTITQVATVVDQRGNPVRGFEVRFFRFGPESGGGEGRAEGVTNSRGQASYSFVGADPGTAKVTAVVSDGVSHRTLVSEVRFRFPVSVVLTATKGDHTSEGGATDELTVRASKVAAGATVSVYRVKGSKLKRVRAKGVKLDAEGKATFDVRDRNGRRKTAYVVVVEQTATTFAATSPARKAR